MTSNRVKLNRMARLESRGQALARQLAKVESQWSAMRDQELLASEEYRNHCESLGVSPVYNWGDVIC